MAGKKTIIFDLDGTLIDSLEDIAICMNKVLKQMNLQVHELKEYKNFLGGGVDFLVDNVLEKDSSIELKKLVTKNFKELYEQKLCSNTKPYDGIYELLDELSKKDYNLAVLSNKPHKFTQAYVNKLFSNYFSKEIHGQKEEIEKKPNPIAAIQIADNFGVSCKEIYFVGDTKIDMQTAKNANMKAIGVLWGFRDKKELVENGADFLVQHPLDILDIVK